MAGKPIRDFSFFPWSARSEGLMWGEARHSLLQFLSKWNKWMEIDVKQRACDLLLAAAAATIALCVAFAFCYVSCHVFICMEQAQRPFCSSFLAEQAINKIPRRILSFFISSSASLSVAKREICTQNLRGTHTRLEQASRTHYHSLTPPNAQSKRNLLQLIFISPEICKRNEFFMVEKFGFDVAGAAQASSAPPVDMLNSKFDVISFCSSTARRWLNELFPFECISRFSNDFRWHLIKISCWVTRSEAGNAIEIAVVYDLFSRVECVHKLIHGAIECKRASVEHWWERDRRSEKTENLHDN